METCELLDGHAQLANGHPVENGVKISDEHSSDSRCWKCRQSCISCCSVCLTEYHPLPENPGIGERVCYAFRCPPHGKLARAISFFLAMFVVWGVLWAVTGEEALPGGNFFALIMLMVLCLIGGGLVSKIKLPPLLGKTLAVLF